MVFDADAYRTQRDRLIAAHAYDPASEHDACGVGLVAAMDAQPRREIVEMAIAALKAVWHRGAVDADGKTGDGAGIRINVPQSIFREHVERTGHRPGPADICVGQIFLPRTDLASQDVARAIVESEILRAGFYLYGWRQVPVNADCLGEKANTTRPAIEQILFCDTKKRSRNDLDRTLYIVRRRIEKLARDAGLLDFYICSLSSQDIVYKGMFLAEEIDNFYIDLTDPRFVSRVAIFHQRYSTNTFPEWRLAQPFRMLAHNGEINTLKGNVNWMKSHEIRMASRAFGADGEAIKPVIQPGSSDSAALDQTFELLMRAGRSAPMAKSLLLPEAWSKRGNLIKPEWQALFEYCNSVMEPWDGPAAIAAYDGRWAIAGLDRNGLRPLRYAITEDGILAVGSETGMCPLGEKKVRERGAVEPGRMIALDLDNCRFYNGEQINDWLSARHPYRDWLENVTELEPEIGPGPEPRLYSGETLARRQAASGMTREIIDLILRPMAETGKEAIGSMGDDTPIAVLSEGYRPLSHYFRQNFSQVTNPPIDPLREAKVMSLKTRFKNLGNILATDEAQTDVFVLDSPILTNGMMARLRQKLDQRVVEIDCTYNFAQAKGDGEALRKALIRIRREAEEAVLGGAGHVVLTDEYQGPGRIAVPMILAAGGAHTHLTDVGQRTYCSLLVRSAECLDAHYCGVLIGVGATAVNPYLAFDTLSEAHARGDFGEMPIGDGVLNMKLALDAGLMKIISKMGISVISAYRGGCNFEALGLSRMLVAEFFPGMTSRISGIGLSGLESDTMRLHAHAFEGEARPLPVGGFYRHRRGSEHHILEAELIHDLQSAVRTQDQAAWERYREALHDQPPSQLRDLLRVRPLGPERNLDEIEPVEDLCTRFVTPGMSLGALSPEAHGTLNIAMNRLGAKSVSGEGGEVPERYKPLPNGDNANSQVKQVASGRFGVTADYLNQASEIEIKVAQGAKPGEGGQLPGFKVTDFIARMRHATPGVTLISPPPHHDIYSIEDLAQLIYDLKQINPVARVCVKLVSAAGIGTIAAGVAKAKADVILISGNVGGTGASPQTSIKFAGAPWELGLAEANQVLTLNNLRGHVTLRTDGGLRTGRDIVIAAMLGAEEFGIGTISLVAMGCLMVRQCHSNTCPVGVCTQDEDLRSRFPGTPDHVVNLMRFLADDVRRILAQLGAQSLEDVIGRADLLDQVSRGAAHLDDLDLNPILSRADARDRPFRSDRSSRQGVVDTLDQRLETKLSPFLTGGAPVSIHVPIANTDRAVGTRISSYIVQSQWKDIPAGHITMNLEGSAGQSLGAFGAKGLRIIVTGDANDYVGKGLSGAEIIVRPDEDPLADDIIIGNTCLYGATSGRLLARGRAGGRFAVRNSGADAVIEGCLSNGCEYMTGGRVVILGPVGDNFAAGMTGGIAYVFDTDGSFKAHLNPDSVAVRFFDFDTDKDCLNLIKAHADQTGSRRALALLSDHSQLGRSMRVVEPLEVLALRQSKTLEVV